MTNSPALLVRRAGWQKQTNYLRMKYMNNFKFQLIILLLVLNNAVVFSQCAMCKSTVESNLSNGTSLAKSLNTGILYLMAIPYIVLMLGAYFFFKKQIDAKIKTWRNKYFPVKQES